MADAADVTAIRKPATKPAVMVAAAAAEAATAVAVGVVIKNVIRPRNVPVHLSRVKVAAAMKAVRVTDVVRAGIAEKTVNARRANQSRPLSLSSWKA